jgi:hypothetical protein
MQKLREEELDEGRETFERKPAVEGVGGQRGKFYLRGFPKAVSWKNRR